MLKILNRSVLNVFLSRVLQQQFVPAVLKLPPICKDPKIASQLCVPAGISLRDSVRSACGMQRQALRLWLDAYHYHILLLADGMTFTLSAWDAIAGRGGSDGTFPDAFFTPLGSFSRPRAKKSHFQWVSAAAPHHECWEEKQTKFKLLMLTADMGHFFWQL